MCYIKVKNFSKMNILVLLSSLDTLTQRPNIYCSSHSDVFVAQKIFLHLNIEFDTIICGLSYKYNGHGLIAFPCLI